MTPYQRRFFAFCIFALAFIFFYEARGERLISLSQQTDNETPIAIHEHFWQGIGAGSFVLSIGTLLLFTLKRSNQKAAFPTIEIYAYALGLGILIGTAIVSWMRLK